MEQNEIMEAEPSGASTPVRQSSMLLFQTENSSLFLNVDEEQMDTRFIQFLQDAVLRKPSVTQTTR